MGKRLYRSRQTKVLGGICGGLGDYFDVDPTIMRLALVLLIFITSGFALLGYLLAWIIIPREPLPGVVPPVGAAVPPAPEPVQVNELTEPKKERSTFVKILPGALLVIFGFVALGSRYWWWEWSDIFPVALILLGLYFILRQWDSSRNTHRESDEASEATDTSVSQATGNGGATLMSNGGEK